MADFGAYDVSSSTSPGGATTTAQNYGISQPAYNIGDDWMGDLQKQANAMNAAGGGGHGGGRGGGGGNLAGTGSGGWIDKSFEHLYDNPGLDLQKAQLAFQQSKWNQAFGALQNQIGAFGSQNPYTIGGSGGPAPEISVGGVYNPQQIDQQVAAARAKNDQATATQQKAAADSATGRGFGTNSPLIAALQGGLAGANIAGNASTEAQIRNTAAQQNASQVLNTQTERENQYEAQQTAAIQRAKPYFDRQNALIAALAGIA